MVEYILGLDNTTSVLLLLGSSVLFLALSSVVYGYWKHETIGMILLGIGLMPLLATMLIVPTTIGCNVPESWFMGLPAGEKMMMRNYIEKEHRPITVYAFYIIQSAYSVEVNAEADGARREQRNKEAGNPMAKQLKAMGS